MIILISSFAVRFAWFSPDNLNGWDIYYHGRISSMVHEDGEVPVYDGLSYEGRRYEYPPLYSVLLSTSLFAGVEPELFASFLSPLVFIISLIFLYLMVKERWNVKTALLSTFLFSFSTSVVVHTNVNAQPTSIAISLFVIMLYFIERGDFYPSLFIGILMPLIHLSSFLIGGLIALKGFFFDSERWVSYLGLLIVGLSLVMAYPYFSHNIPEPIASNLFSLSIGNFLNVGPFLILLGCLAFYKERGNSFWGLIAFLPILLIFLNLIETNRGFLFSALGFSVLGSSFLVNNWGWPDYSKMGQILCWSVVILMVSFRGFHLFSYPVISDDLVLTPEEKEAFVWMRENTPRDSVVMSGPDHWVTGISRRKSYLDGFFQGEVNTSGRYRKVRCVFSSCDDFLEYVQEVDYVLVRKGTQVLDVDTSKHDEYLINVFENEEVVIYEVPRGLNDQGEIVNEKEIEFFDYFYNFDRRGLYRNMDAREDYLFWVHNGKFLSLNLSNPLYPSQVDSVDINTTYPGALGISVTDDGYAYVGDGSDPGPESNGLKLEYLQDYLLVFNVSDPGDIVEVSRIQDKRLKGSHGISLGSSENYLYLTGYRGDHFTILDISDREDPEIIGNVSGFKDDPGRGPHDVVTDSNEDHAFVSDYSGRVHSVDVSDKENPEVIDVLDLEGANYSAGARIIDDSHVLVGAGSHDESYPGHLVSVNVTDPENISESSRASRENKSRGEYRIRVDGDRAYSVDSKSYVGLGVWNVSDPSNIELLRSIKDTINIEVLIHPSGDYVYSALCHLCSKRRSPIAIYEVF